ncbi:MAG: hypothetical protein RMI91_04345 [Gemmatales bacterium]|nr:SMP-30/gluconolactonase/LRE family protein [Gemmatales bacterium]MDW7993865.1 hypothetical protein [Gemmatales bacterium]
MPQRLAWLTYQSPFLVPLNWRKLTRLSLGLAGLVLCLTFLCPNGSEAQQAKPEAIRWLWTTAYAIPKHLTNQGSGYFSIVEGKNGCLYIGTAKYGENAYLVEFNTRTKEMKVVVDVMKTLGSSAKGFAAQSKIHTRNNVGESGKIYFGTKQGYPEKGEKRTDYPGGYPMVYDPQTGKVEVYPIPVPHHGIISITPDESRGLAYISTCSDDRPVESTHFLILDLKTGKYKHLMDCEHMYAFIVLDYLGRAYHPIRGGDIARYDPRTDKLERLKQTIDGQPPKDSLLAHPHSHPINWEVSPDRKTLYAVAMNENQLYAYDLTAEGEVLPGRRLGALINDPEARTDCRALCVGPDGTVWMGVAVHHPKREHLLHIVSYKPGEKGCRDHGPIAIRNPDYTRFTDEKGRPLPWHHGVRRRPDGILVPQYHIMGICAATNGKVYATTIIPLTLHEIEVK